jgi:uncharacterized membrane protein
MNRVLVVIFSEASAAFDGRDSLKSLDHEDLLTLYGYAIVTKKPDGTCDLIDSHELGGLPTVLGSSLGSLIGLLGGPAGFAIGTMAGFLAGLTADLNTARVSAGFVDEVSRELTPGKFALVADVDEDWTRWVDLRMQELGGVTYRETLSEVTDAANTRDVVAMTADLATLKAEHAQADLDRKAKLFGKINELETKLQQQLTKAKEQREEAVRLANAKAEILKSKAAAAKEKAAKTPDLVRG